MIELPRLTSDLLFPPAESALQNPNGLVAFGGDLSVERLKLAYHSGIFPWFSEGEPILWWSPDPRGIIELDNFHCSRSLAKFIKKTPLSVTLNLAFTEVIKACADIPREDTGTWITDDMIQAYIRLHDAGYAHSIEVWDNNELVGGLYGVLVGNVFCGESMFHRISNASKLAMYFLVKLAEGAQIAFIDCQMQNNYLASMGCIEISRQVFLNKLQDANATQPEDRRWHRQLLKI